MVTYCYEAPYNPTVIPPFLFFFKAVPSKLVFRVISCDYTIAIDEIKSRSIAWQEALNPEGRSTVMISRAHH